MQVVALPAAGIAIGVVLTATSATGHVGGWARDWREHVGPKADARYPQRLWAVVGSDGDLARGNRVTGVIDVGEGRIVVRFDRNVGDCAYLATPGSPGASGIGDPGEIDVVGEGGNERGVR